ncbi:hypothetical protein BYT27DRAFT_7341134 [Phlegmacium glaucopus]|nr:hypothetical protein BYT27DRAFT_7341134 [Phlegmacium glaucopus]
MVGPYVFLLVITLATGPALSFSDEYERRSSELDHIRYGRGFVDRRDSGVLYGRDLEFADFLEKRMHMIHPASAAIAMGSSPIVGTAAGAVGKGLLKGTKALGHLIGSQGLNTLNNVKTTSDIVKNGFAAYHDGNKWNSNIPGARPPAPSVLNVHIQRRELEYEEEFGRDLHNEELFGREYLVDDIDY